MYCQTSPAIILLRALSAFIKPKTRQKILFTSCLQNRIYAQLIPLKRDARVGLIHVF